MRRLVVAALALVVSAATAQAGGLQTVLTPDSILYAIDGATEDTQLSVSRRQGADTNDALLVPGTEDPALDSDARLLFDQKTSTLFVIWHKAAAVQDSIMLASVDAKGNWSEPVVLSSCSSRRRIGLRTMLTRATDEETGVEATLIHAVWWGVGSDLTAEYALVAFEGAQLVSTEVSTLDELAGRHNADGAEDYEDTGAALHPPLALARTESSGVDVVYGAANSTKIARVRVEPRRVKGDARLWKPLGRDGGRTGRSKMVTTSTAPVQAFISKGRIVLYRPDEKFRFVVLENGEWSPERMIQLDQSVSSEEVLRELRKTVDELAATDAPAQQ
ncbi:MAG TPA: hypothetical protein VF911_22175 [Thermoanaerobaculia bacterium]|jgi:hypothetical protein